MVRCSSWPLLLFTGLLAAMTLFAFMPSSRGSIGSHVIDDNDNFAQEFSKDTWYYGIIIDAGSSGSRLFVYVWPPHLKQGELLKIRPLLGLDGRPVVKKVNPGLSSFAEHPADATGYIKPLLDYAAAHIPIERHKETPLFIMATAGMRLIPEHQCNAILTNLREGLPKLYDFIMLPKQIEIISGKWEGIYSWIAVNYALGRLDHEPNGVPNIPVVSALDSNVTMTRKATVGMIDMGGGSVQIAFEVHEAVPKSEEHLIADINLGCVEHDVDHTYRLYVTTFLGLGANEAQARYENLLKRQFLRQKLLSTFRPPITSTENVDSEVTEIQDMPLSSDKSAIVTDPCLPAKRVIPVYDIIAENTSNVLFARKGSGNFFECVAALQPLLSQNISVCSVPPCSMNGVHQPGIDFENAEFYGFSEFWYSTDDILNVGGVYSYNKFTEAAQTYCGMSWSVLMRHFQNKLYPKADKERLRSQCFKAAWIALVLHEGFHFPKTVKKFTNVNTLNGAEVQWTLGALLYRMRFFPLRDIQRLKLESSSHHNSITGSHHYFGGPLSQYLLVLCMLVVVLAAFRYCYVLRKFKNRYQPSMSRTHSLSSYMMLDTNYVLQGLKIIDKGDYVH